MSLDENSYKQTEDALNSITDSSTQNLHEDPKSHLHKEADHEKSHSFMSKLIDHSSVKSMENKFHLGNYVIDRKTGQKSWESMSIYVRLGMHLLYYGSYQEKLLQWKKTETLLKDKSEAMGKAYDAPESVSHIEPFIKSFGLESSMQEMKEPDPTKYKTFNDFFAREIREDARPIDDPNNDLVTSSPADCRLTAFQTVDLATKYWIKGYGFTLEKLLNSSELAQTFNGGSIVIARLAPQDYHRWHAPVSGTVVSVSDIPGTYYTVNPQAINQEGTMDVFCQNKRSVMLLKRKDTGSQIAIIAVGAMLVGSIKYVNGADKPGTELHRGQCTGAFYYGGSTVIVLYPRGEVTIDEDLARNSTHEACETLMRVGWRVGEKK